MGSVGQCVVSIGGGGGGMKKALKQMGSVGQCVVSIGGGGGMKKALKQMGSVGQCVVSIGGGGGGGGVYLYAYVVCSMYLCKVCLSRNIGRNGYRM